MRLLLDTNFLITCVKFRIDFFDALERLEEKTGKIEVFIPMFCVQEMQLIMNDVKEAKLALQMLNNPVITVLDIGRSNESVDDAIVRCSDTNGYAVATNDKELIEKAKTHGIQVVRIRQMKYFDVE